MIRFDFQVNDWSRLFTEDEEIIADPETKIIWRGAGTAEGTGRLFKSVLRNPFPGKQVDSMDLISTRSGCTYVLVAATVAQSDPDREVTPPMPLLAPRHFDGALRVHVVDKKTGAPLVGAEVYPAMSIGDTGLVADNVLTGNDGAAVVKYPKAGAKDLRIKVTKAGYGNCEIHWNNGWQAGEIPEEITYRLAPDGATGDDASPDFTLTPPPHPTLLAAGAATAEATGKNPAVMIRTATKIVQIDEDDYQSHRADIDNAVRNGDVAPLTTLKSFNLISEPASLTRSGERAVMEAVRVFPYPAAFEKDAAGNFQPTDFKRQNLGVHFVMLPTFVAGKISFKGDLNITSLAGWTPTEGKSHQPIFHVRELPVSESFAPGQIKGFEVPGGAQMEPVDPDAVQSPKALRRIFLFLNAQALHEDGSPMTGQLIEMGPAKTEGTTQIPAAPSTASGPLVPLQKAAYAPSGTNSTDALPDDDAAKEKLKSIVVDELDFDQVDVRTVLQVLAAKCKALNPDKKSIHFALRLGYGAKAQGAGPAIDPRVRLKFSLRNQNIPLTEVLNYLTEQTNLIWTVDSHEIWLRPPPEENPDTFAVRTYSVPPNFIVGSYPEASGAGSRIDVSNELRNRGLIFADGATATFLPAVKVTLMGGKLEVRNTVKQLDLLSLLLDQMTRDSRQSVEIKQDAPDALPAPNDPPATASPATTSGQPTPAATRIQDVTISGKLQLTPSGQVDLAKSVGYLQSVDGGSIEFHFQPDGSFAVPNVRPGVYNRRVHLVPTAPGADAVDMTLAPVTVDGSASRMTTNLNLAVQIAGPTKGSIEIGLKIMEISDDVYLANKAKVDAAVEKADIDFFNHMEGVDLLSTPSVWTQPGTKATIDIVRKVPYPIKFDPAERVLYPDGATVIVPMTPTDFVTKDVGISAEITPTINAANSPDPGKIVLNGKFSVTDFEGFTKSNINNIQMPAFETRESLFIEALNDNQEKGIWIPGGRFDEETITDKGSFEKLFSEKKETVKKRLLLFVSASLVK